MNITIVAIFGIAKDVIWFMLSETVDSTSNSGKGERYESFLVSKSQLDEKGCGFHCMKCQMDFSFAKLKLGRFRSSFSHTAALMEILR